MSDKSFSSWVSRSEVEATMGVEPDSKTGCSNRAVIDCGPGNMTRVVDMPVDLFGPDGKFVGLGFDGEVFSLSEMTDLIQRYARDIDGNVFLFAHPVFRADRTFAGFQIVGGEA